jgi:hypothetical protein
MARSRYISCRCRLQTYAYQNTVYQTMREAIDGANLLAEDQEHCKGNALSSSDGSRTYPDPQAAHAGQLADRDATFLHHFGALPGAVPGRPGITMRMMISV